MSAPGGLFFEVRRASGEGILDSKHEPLGVVPKPSRNAAKEHQRFGPALQLYTQWVLRGVALVAGTVIDGGQARVYEKEDERGKQLVVMGGLVGQATVV